MGPVIITTDRLNLRSWTLDDAPLLVELFEDEQVNRFINDGRPISLESAELFMTRYERMQHERGWCRWALELAEQPGRLAGFCGFGCTFAPEIELGWTLRSDLWGRGLATEAARAAITYGFETVGFARIVSAVSPENSRSAAVAERLGMHTDGHIDFEHHRLVRYAVDNPGPIPLPDPRYMRHCDGEPAGRTLAASDATGS